ncbi:MAG: GIY-YIG nuclease family protein [Bacteroidales bacterium]|nr:GIY-YIG nuclease family protein [Bacteroidales bacterium]
MWYVYILKCADDRFYTGCTSNLDQRLERHQNKQVHYTQDKLPVELVTYVVFKDKYKAFDFER